MVDKVKTINKAQRKYRFLFPARGKSSLEESFFCLRGEIFFQFKTRDNKVHTIKAVKYRPAQSSARSSRAFLHSFFRLINKPIFIRSLFFKNMNSTPLMFGYYVM